MGILLFLIALWLFVVFLIPGVIHVIVGAFRHKGKFSYINESLLTGALAIDIAGNVVFGTMFNDWLVKRGAWHYGSLGETVSAVTGINYMRGTLNWVGIGLCMTLNIIDFKNWKNGGHCYVAMDSLGKSVYPNPPKWTKDLYLAFPFLIIMFALLYFSTWLLLWLIYLL